MSLSMQISSSDGMLVLQNSRNVYRATRWLWVLLPLEIQYISCDNLNAVSTFKGPIVRSIHKSICEEIAGVPWITSSNDAVVYILIQYLLPPWTCVDTFLLPYLVWDRVPGLWDTLWPCCGMRSLVSAYRVSIQSTRVDLPGRSIQPGEFESQHKLSRRPNDNIPSVGS